MTKDDASKFVGEFVSQLQRLAQSADSVWQQYQALGPGKLDRDSFEPVDAAFQSLQRFLKHPKLGSLAASIDADAAWPADLAEHVRQAHDLARRCACTSQGLSFVTGESGLIPRKDQHDAFRAALEFLRAQCEKLSELM